MLYLKDINISKRNVLYSSEILPKIVCTVYNTETNEISYCSITEAIKNNVVGTFCNKNYYFNCIISDLFIKSLDYFDDVVTVYCDSQEFKLNRKYGTGLIEIGGVYFDWSYNQDDNIIYLGSSHSLFIHNDMFVASRTTDFCETILDFLLRLFRQENRILNFDSLIVCIDRYKVTIDLPDKLKRFITKIIVMG
jgi:hypothetical protein